MAMRTRLRGNGGRDGIDRGGDRAPFDGVDRDIATTRVQVADDLAELTFVRRERIAELVH